MHLPYKKQTKTLYGKGLQTSAIDIFSFIQTGYMPEKEEDQSFWEEDCDSLRNYGLKESKTY